MLRWLFGRPAVEVPKGQAPGPVQLDLSRVVVIDADTIKLDGELVRLVGFDAPETDRADSEHEARMGEAAAKRLAALLNEPNHVTMTRLPERDIHGRGLARLFVNDRDVAEIAIEEGWGVRYDYDGKRRTSDEMPDWDEMQYPR